MAELEKTLLLTITLYCFSIVNRTHFNSNKWKQQLQGPCSLLEKIKVNMYLHYKMQSAMLGFRCPIPFRNPSSLPIHKEESERLKIKVRILVLIKLLETTAQVCSNHKLVLTTIIKQTNPLISTGEGPFKTMHRAERVLLQAAASQTKGRGRAALPMPIPASKFMKQNSLLLWEE